MTEQLDFDKIRPFFDSEVNEALMRLTKIPGFIKTARFLFPHYPIEQVLTQLRKVNSLKEFQTNFVAPFFHFLIDKSITKLSFSGLEKLDRNKSYLFISNHRDIILDSALLNYILLTNNFETAESAIGSNLLIFPWIKDLMKLNKTFIVVRNAPARKMLEFSALLSQYMRFTLKQKNTSIWIAQREGRTKNGDDRTQPSLLKMLNISGKKDFASNFKELNIVPLAISYELEPCDIAKVTELYVKATDENYKKSKTDDLASMGKGLTSFKGNVHFGFGTPLDKELDELNSISNKNEQYNQLAAIIDNQIHKGFMLFPKNYVAYDLLHKKPHYTDLYTSSDKTQFNTFVTQQLKDIKGDNKRIKEMFLKIYANPVKNKKAIEMN